MRDVVQWQTEFTEKAEKFHMEYKAFTRRIEESFETLHQFLGRSVAAGVQEVQEHIREDSPRYTCLVAREFWSPREGLILMEEKAEISEVFEAMGKCLNEAQEVLQVKCPNLLFEFQEENFTLLRTEFEAHAFKRKLEKSAPWKPLKTPENPINTANTGEKGVTATAIVSSFLERSTVHFRKVIKQPVLIQVLLTALIISMMLPCFWDWSVVSLNFPSPRSREILETLGPYNGGNGATSLITTGPIHLKTGYYKGQWEPKKTGKATQESRISGYGLMAYTNGDIYEGYFKQGKRHGNGRLITATGDILVGMWQTEAFSGWGNCTYADGSMKTGHWIGWKLHGLGQVIEKSSISMGAFEGDKMSGTGLQYTSNSDFIFGTWRNGTVHGPTLESREGNILLGNYELGELQGNVTCIEASGVRYVGQWNKGLKEGKGVETYPAEYYEGLWTQGHQSFGQYNYNSTFRLHYEGSANDLIRNEFDESWLISTSTNTTFGNYHGQFSHKRLRHGYGIQHYSDHSYYGSWKSGKRNGQGKVRNYQGDTYEGMWLAGEFTGWGKAVYANGVRKNGLWKAGKLQGLGYVERPNIQALGTFNGGIMEGLGLQYTNFSVFSAGNWSNGQLTGPGISYNDGLIRLIGGKSSTMQEYRVNSTLELCIRRHSRTKEWWFVPSTGTQVEAVTVQVDKPIILTAIGIGAPIEIPNSLKLLIIRSGNSTSGPILYTHDSQPLLNPASNLHFAKIVLQRSILLQANTQYTVIVQYSPDSYVHYGFDAEMRVEGGVDFAFSRSILSGNDTGVTHTYNSPLRDFYFLPPAS